MSVIPVELYNKGVRTRQCELMKGNCTFSFVAWFKCGIFVMKISFGE